VEGGDVVEVMAEISPGDSRTIVITVPAGVAAGQQFTVPIPGSIASPVATAVRPTLRRTRAGAPSRRLTF
jgi:hypothetical protein